MMNSNGKQYNFYITLPSESSKKLFPENNASEYTVRLPQWIHLKGNWQIGLHSIAYTPWNIIRQLDGSISFTYPDKGTTKTGTGGKMRKHYSSVNEYVSGINESLKEASVSENEIRFSFELNGKVMIRLSSGYKVCLRREQAIVLGFVNFEDSAETYDVEDTETGTYKANLYRETNIHVYCDIVQPQIVGDKMAPLVAIVPCQKTTETYETLYAVENIHYVPVQTKSFQNIKVHLRSSTNESIPFEHGRAAITLHLKLLDLWTDD